MCSIVAADFSTLPAVLYDEFDLRPRIHNRGGEPEVWFAFTDPRPLLPVLDGGVVKLIRWGSKARDGRLPLGGWTWRETIEDGGWARIGCETEPVIIVGDFGYEDGVWIVIQQGIHGVLVRPPGDPPVVYMVCEKPTHYYRVLTGSNRKPCLLNQVI